MKRSASALSTRKCASSSPAVQCSTAARTKEKCWRSRSTLTTSGHPRLNSSRVMLPVPANKSSARVVSKSTYARSTLNRFSLAKSVVGRALNERGTSKCLPLYFPVMMRISSINWSVIQMEVEIIRSAGDNRIPARHRHIPPPPQRDGNMRQRPPSCPPAHK